MSRTHWLLQPKEGYKRKNKTKKTYGGPKLHKHEQTQRKINIANAWET